MEILVNVVTILAVGFVILVCGYGLIGKVAEEQRKNSDYAMVQIAKIFKEMPKVATNTYSELKKLEEEENKKQNERIRKQLEDCNKDLVI